MNFPRLHPDTIEEVKQRTDILDVVSDRVVLKKRGKDYVGLCPFHEEKTPSFTVSPSKNMYYCFGCGAGGNAITFLKELDKHSFSEVVLDLARRYQVSVKTLEPEQRQEFQRQLSIREQLYEILALASSFYQHALRQSQGSRALEYLKSERQLSEVTIQQFQLGYAPAGWETLYGYLVGQKRYPVELVEQAGLIVPRKSGGGYYDRFRDRLMIPIQDIQARIIGFGGRTLTDEQPKYLNSPETQLFDKGKTLFALDRAKKAIVKEDQAVVVEGYFDAIALHAAGISHVVASLGTALSKTQVRQLLRYTESKQIVFNFDADAAGVKAAKRAIGEIADLAYKGQVQLRILNIPDGKDADDFLKNSGSPEPYRQLLAAAPLWIDWQMEQILAGQNLKEGDRYQQVARGMVELLREIQGNESLTHYVNLAAELLSQGDARRSPLIAEDLLRQIKRPNLRSDAPREHKREEPSITVPGDRSLLEQAESDLLRLYLHCPHYREAIDNKLEERDLDFSLSDHRFLWQQMFKIQPGAGLSGADLISKLQDLSVEFPDRIARLSRLFYLDELTERDMQRGSELIYAAAATIERVMCEKRYRYFLQFWQETDPIKEREKCQLYYQEFFAAEQRMKELDEQRSLKSWL